MDFTALRYFSATAHSRSIRAASDRLHVSPSAISRQIAKLEHELRAPIFDRRAQGMKLIYDPAVLVEHFPGVRPIEENRAYFNPVSHGDEIFNRPLVVVEYLGTQRWGWLRQTALMAYLTLRGSRKAPGLLLLAVGLATRYPNTWGRFQATFAAYRDALAAVRSARS